MQIFDFPDYRQFIRYCLKRKGMTAKKMAELTRIHPAYFSRVLVGQANFSSQQIFFIADSMNLDEWEVDYLLLMVNFETSNLHEYKVFLQKKMKKIKDDRLSLKKKLTMTPLKSLIIEEYYRHPLTALIHMFLLIKSNRINPLNMLKKLHISKGVLFQELDRLESLGIINRGKELELLVRSVHIPDDHHLARQVHANWRVEMAYLLNRQVNENQQHYSFLIALSQDSYLDIQRKLKTLIIEIGEKVEAPEPEETVCALLIDLFPYR